MKQRKIFSPYYDFKSFQCQNPYVKSPKKISSSRGAKTASAESSAYQTNRKDAGLSHSSGDVNKSFQEANVNEKKPEQLELFPTSKSCQTSPIVPRVSAKKRIVSQNFFALSQQQISKK